MNNPNPTLTKARIDDFWSQVTIGKGEDDCWQWEAPTPSFVVSGDALTLSRAAWVIQRGPLPLDESTGAPAFIYRTCGSSRCVRGEHLRLKARPDARPQRPQRRTTNIRRGARHWKAKLTQALVDEIREKYDSGDATLKDLAAAYRVGTTTVHRVVLRQTWKPASVTGAPQ